MTRSFAAALTSRNSRQPPPLLNILALLISLALLVPVGYLLLRAAQSGGDSLDFALRLRTGKVLLNTVVLAAAVSLTASLIAISAALLTDRVDLPLGQFWSPLMAMPLVVPSYVAAMTYVAMFGPRGFVFDWLHSWFGVAQIPSIYGFSGSWLTLSLFTFPYVYLNVRAALAGLDPIMEEAARGLGVSRTRTFLRITLPLLRPGIVAGALLSALYAVSDFGVVTLFRYDALTRAIYVQYRSSFDRTQAAVLALLLVAFTMLILLIESRSSSVYFRSGSGTARKQRRVSIGRWRYPALAFLFLIVLMTLVVPVGVLLYWLERAYARGGYGEHFRSAAMHSVALGIAGAIIAVTLGFCVAFLAARYDSPVGRWSERLAWLGYGLPGIVIGLAFVFIGANYLPTLYQTLPLLVGAYVVRFLPQAVGVVKSSLLQINPHLEEAGRGLGRNQIGVLRAITLPLTRPAVIAAAVMVTLSIMKELPITLLLAPTGYRTLATQIWTGATVSAFGEAAAPALLLILLALIPALMLTGRRVALMPVED